MASSPGRETTIGEVAAVPEVACPNLALPRATLHPSHERSKTWLTVPYVLTDLSRAEKEHGTTDELLRTQKEKAVVLLDPLLPVFLLSVGVVDSSEFYVSLSFTTASCTLVCGRIRMNPLELLRGTILNGTCGIHKNLYIFNHFYYQIFGPIHYGPP